LPPVMVRFRRRIRSLLSAIIVSVFLLLVVARSFCATNMRKKEEKVGKE